MESSNVDDAVEDTEDREDDDSDGDGDNVMSESEDSTADEDQREEPANMEEQADLESDSESEGEFDNESDSTEDAGGLDGEHELTLADVEQLINMQNLSVPPSLVVNSNRQDTEGSNRPSADSIQHPSYDEVNTINLPLSPLPSPLPLNPPSTSQTDNANPPGQEETHFTQKTIRRVMSYLTSSHDVRISHPSVKAVSVALECFIQSFIQEAYRHAQKSQRNQIKYTDLAYVANHFSPLYFLQEYLPQPQPAGYVVRKTLESAGVDIETSFATPESEGQDQSQEDTSKASTGSLTSAAFRLAKRWDMEADNSGWRSTPSKLRLSSTTRQHKRSKTKP